MTVKDKKWIKIRIYITGVCFFLIFCVIFLRAYQLQILEGGKLSSLAKESYTGESTFTSQRGTIFDRNGEELALSIAVNSIYCYPQKVRDKGRTATLVSRALNINERDVFGKLGSSRSFGWIKRKVTPEEIQRVKGLNLPGIEFIEESRRYYPCIETGAHIIGFANQDNRGIEGIELKYNKYLEGQKVSFSRVHDALGRPLFVDEQRAERQDPFNLILTLDKEINYQAQKRLREAVQESKAKSGICVVMKPQTGEILAMAIVPEFNPNVFWNFKPYRWRNRGITDCFEPGSTLKAFLLASALEEGLVKPETVFDCEKGLYQIGSFVVHDSRAYGKLPVSDIIKFSSNIGAIKIGQKLGAESFHDYLKKFGFGERTGVDFPGERTGMLRSVRNTSLVGQNNLYFGHGISVTALQLTAAFGAIANDGNLMRPYLVKSITDQAGKIVKEFRPLLKRNIISPDTARRARHVLEGVASDGGTAPQAAINGYSVAGKTGTAQKVDSAKKTYSDEKFVAIFGGFAPADSPEIVVLVALDEPQGTPYGGTVAAPVFSDVGYCTLASLNIAPSYRERVAVEEKVQDEGEEEIFIPVSPGMMPDVKGLGVRDVLKKARSMGIKAVVKGSGRAVRQNPAPGTLLKKDGSLTVTFEPPC
jgi:cell division protein FtsI (penicillin-binding protein 3)